ncbi:hypothetical protein J3D56_000816 [Erwinia persicina]|uniref:Uncharacterized protein n=2 Tax=Erwinia TaxID=551 RepID=A0ABV4E3Y1_9GAMM|nr:MULTISPECIES: hypothetical protein [Erwinia]MCP1437380.1 hypothetical protein [Erwinia persicina]MDN4628565.1 hypothetical protein [Erwinia sp. PsM31]MDN8540751.1 hypothetical protein [Erwinia sp. BC051422]
MNVENPEEAMTFGELLALIADQQRRLSVLEVAFSSLSLCLDEQAALRLVDKLRLEATRSDYDENKRQHFAALADELAKRAG